VPAAGPAPPGVAAPGLTGGVPGRRSGGAVRRAGWGPAGSGIRCGQTRSRPPCPR